MERVLYGARASTRGRGRVGTRASIGGSEWCMDLGLGHGYDCGLKRSLGLGFVVSSLVLGLG